MVSITDIFVTILHDGLSNAGKRKGSEDAREVIEFATMVADERDEDPVSNSAFTNERDETYTTGVLEFFSAMGEKRVVKRSKTPNRDSVKS